MISAENDDIEELLIALRRAQAQLAVSRLRKQAEMQKVNRLSEEEIQAEILQARRERK